MNTGSFTRKCMINTLKQTAFKSKSYFKRWLMLKYLKIVMLKSFVGSKSIHSNLIFCKDWIADYGLDCGE